MTLKLTILGCGNSDGVPAISNYWGKCDPHEPKNRRTRASLAVQSENATLLIDSGPDVRLQLNREGINKIDAVIYTHAHADHVSGIDDLRSYAKYNKTTLEAYGTQETLDELMIRFDYQFVQKSKLYPAVLKPRVFTKSQFGQVVRIGDIAVIPFAQQHHKITSLGFRFGDVAYSTDVSDFSDAALDVLKGIDTWIVDAAGYTMPKNIAHLTLEKLYMYQKTVQARRVIMTHLSPGMDYQTLMNETPDHFEPAYDGMVIDVL
jgi:phosphoribosyl 1,2-cyclic phosphate phosphodiesterase